MMNEDELEIVLDDRSAKLTYDSDCIFCKYLHSNDWSCHAYPGGIPDALMVGTEKHRHVRKDQTGKFVYEKDPKYT